MAAVGAPAIREEPPDAEGLQQRFQLQERLVLSPPEDVGEDSPGSMVQGLPQPAWLLAHKISSASCVAPQGNRLNRDERPHWQDGCLRPGRPRWSQCTRGKTPGKEEDRQMLC